MDEGLEVKKACHKYQIKIVSIFCKYFPKVLGMRCFPKYHMCPLAWKCLGTPALGIHFSVDHSTLLHDINMCNVSLMEGSVFAVLYLRLVDCKLDIT